MGVLLVSGLINPQEGQGYVSTKHVSRECKHQDARVKGWRHGLTNFKDTETKCQNVVI